MELLICPIAVKHVPNEYMSGSNEDFVSNCDCLSIAMLMTAMSGKGLWLLRSATPRLDVAVICNESRACESGPLNRMTKAKRGVTRPFCIAPDILRV